MYENENDLRSARMMPRCLLVLKLRGGQYGVLECQISALCRFSAIYQQVWYNITNICLTMRLSLLFSDLYAEYDLASRVARPWMFLLVPPGRIACPTPKTVCGERVRQPDVG